VIGRFAPSHLWQAIAAGINRAPVRYERLPVNVGGFRLVAHTFDRYLGLWLRKCARWQAAEVEAVRRFCRPGSHVLDIGANIGFYSLVFSRAVGPGGHVWAFEPDPDNFSTLQRNIRLNAPINVTTVQAAVSSKSGQAMLHRSPANAGDHRLYHVEHGSDSVPVGTVSLDDFFSSPLPPIDVIKMDIQGAEGQALLGMTRILRENRPLTLVIEFWPDGLSRSGTEPVAVLQNLRLSGFCLARLDERAARASPISDIDDFVTGLPAGAYVTIVATAPATDA
jgi:FkbM family methyltransferase